MSFAEVFTQERGLKRGADNAEDIVEDVYDEMKV